MKDPCGLFLRRRSRSIARPPWRKKAEWAPSGSCRGCETASPRRQKRASCSTVPEVFTQLQAAKPAETTHDSYQEVFDQLQPPNRHQQQTNIRPSPSRPSDRHPQHVRMYATISGHAYHLRGRQTGRTSETCSDNARQILAVTAAEPQRPFSAHGRPPCACQQLAGGWMTFQKHKKNK